ncbi:MAG: hypothetical protein ACKV0T_03630 [Planctomycetales bacterium]
MPGLLPYRFLFRYALPVSYEGRLPGAGKKLLGLTETHRLPDLGRLDDTPGFAELRLAWNERGLAVAVHVEGKQRALECDAKSPETSDGLQLWIDTRNTHNIHRASRFCQAFSFLPKGGGADKRSPVAAPLPIARAKEAPPAIDPQSLSIECQTGPAGYHLAAWLPSEALHGYDPAAQPQLGFYYHVHDAELGDQHLSVGPEFGCGYDPSLWGTLDLMK